VLAGELAADPPESVASAASNRSTPAMSTSSAAKRDERAAQIVADGKDPECIDYGSYRITKHSVTSRASGLPT
jgi:hypothetical protein